MWDGDRWVYVEGQRVFPEIELEVQAACGSITFVEHVTIAVSQMEARGDALHSGTDEIDKSLTSFEEGLSLYYTSKK